jgi:anion-transporting  ArsA/GET3 family ATPase
MPRSLLDQRFLILAGKGGVGRTTVAAALARAAAARGKRVLLAQTAAVERLAGMLGRDGPIGPKVRSLAPGIDAVNMTPREALHEYALMVLKYETLYRALFENRAVRGFLGAVPGLDAYAMLGKAWWHTTESAPDGGRKYDLVILDGPASGHALFMLRLPGAILETTPSGPLARDARQLHTLLVDPEQASLVVVTLPEELPVRETGELVRAARAELGMALGPLVVNAMPPGRLNEGAADAVLGRLPPRTGDAALDATLAMAAGLRSRRRAAEDAVARLRAELDLPLRELPWLPAVGLGLREIDALAAALVRAEI